MQILLLEIIYMILIYKNKLSVCIYTPIICSCPLNNTGLNCMDPLICRFLKTVNSTVLHNPWLVESMDVVSWIQKNHGYWGTTYMEGWT